MKKIIVIIFAVFALIHSAKAQVDQNAIKKINHALVAHFNTYGSDTFSSRPFKDRAFAFGFVISVNRNGKVDTVIFSNRTKTLDSLVSFNTIVKEMKKLKVFGNYKNVLLYSTALVKRSWDSEIKNTRNIFNANRKEYVDFESYMYNITPVIPPALADRKLILLPAFSLVLGKAVR